jgi:hypothetical protein
MYFNELEGGNWKTQNRFGTGTRAMDALRSAWVAGLRYVVLHRSWASASDRDAYVAGVTAIGGRQVGHFGDDDLYELADPPPSRAPAAGDIAVELERVEHLDQLHHEVLVWIDFQNKTDQNLYDPGKIKRFQLTATSGGQVVGEGQTFLLPPLFVPHGNYETRIRLKLASGRHPDWAEMKITDDDGNVVGNGNLKIAR